jgi:glutathione synthase/RimK-type ligase-like ATP-grasp enzyme
LKERGHQPVITSWDDPKSPLPQVQCCVVRSVWSYADHPAQFRRWLGEMSSSALVINPPKLLEWNMRKGYLRDLAKWGLAVVPSELVSAGEPMRIAEVIVARGWRDAVVKGAIDIGGRTVRRLRLDSYPNEATFRAAISAVEGKDVVVQPFVASLMRSGEVLAVFIDGEFTHAIRRRPAPGSFLTTEAHGGWCEPTAVTGAQLRLASEALACLPQWPVFARVDMVDFDGGPAIQELELIDPHLYLRLHRPAARRLANAVAPDSARGRKAALCRL